MQREPRCEQPEHIGFLIKLISDKMKAHADASMRCSDLTFSQFHVLGFLAQHGGEGIQKDLEEFLGVSHPTVVGLVSRLEKKGFITTWMDEQDRRVKRIRMTDKAIALGDEMKSSRNRREETLRRNMSDAEAAELTRLLRIVYGNVCEAASEETGEMEL